MCTWQPLISPEAPTTSGISSSPGSATARCSSPAPACSGRRRTATPRSPCCATAVDLGITHIDTADFYGPHVTNEIIREALAPYPDDLHIVTKVGARRDAEGGWPHARTPAELQEQVHDNLRRLGLDVLDVVNLRVGGFDAPEPRLARASSSRRSPSCSSRG